MCKISVIIPVYNVEKYLRQCLDSVINQTYKNIEIICVNDCSTDRSGEILEEYAQKDSRIKVLNTEKRLPVGSVRNLGVDSATGEYLHFLDSDDWLEINAYELLDRILQNNRNLDMILFLYRSVSELSGEICQLEFKNPSLENTVKTIDECEIFIEDWDGHIWNKLYSTKFLKQNTIRFNEDPCYEDKSYSVEVLVKAKNIYFYNKILLNYRINRPQSLVNNYYKYTDFVCSEYDEIVGLCKNLTEKQISLICYKELNDIFYILQNSYLNKKLTYDDFKSRVSDFNTGIIDRKFVPRKLFSQMNNILRFSESQFRMFYFTRKFLTDIKKKLKF